MHPFQRTTLIRLGKCFSWICAKVVDPRDLPGLQLFVTKTICLLEICMPPTFFDLMEHMLIHLVDDLVACGPVGGRWLYPLERYMGVLKGWVRNKARLEASIVSSYMSEEALGFCTEYFSLYTHSNRRVWESAEDMAVEGYVLEGRGRRHKLFAEEVEDIHNYFLQHAVEIMQERREHEQAVAIGATVLSLREWIRLKVLETMGDGVEVVHDVICLSNPPQRISKSFRSMFAFGAHFRVDDEEHVL